MSEAVVDDIVAVLPPLLQSLEALSFIARHLNPPEFEAVMEAAGLPDQALQAVRPRLADWPEQFETIRTALEAASDAALRAFAGLREVQHGNGDLIAVFRALRHAPRAQEALYALAARLPPVRCWPGIRRPRCRCRCFIRATASSRRACACSSTG
jgi:phospholipase/carboxylesterase